jgi:hypothetical protein
MQFIGTGSGHYKRWIFCLLATDGKLKLYIASPSSLIFHGQSNHAVVPRFQTFAAQCSATDFVFIATDVIQKSLC